VKMLELERSSTQIIGSFNNIPVIFRQNNTERMRIDSSGNVGIGTTSPAASVGSSIDATGPLLVGGYIASHQTSKGVVELFDNNQMKFRAYGATANSGFFSFSSGGGGSADTERMRIDSSGNVGIGTTSINNPFSFNTATQIGDVTEGTSLLTLAGTTQGSIFFADSASGTGAYTGYIEYQHGGNYMSFGTGGGSERMRLTNSGTLLVSTTTASGLSNGTTNYGHSFGGGQQVNATNNDTNLILNMSNGSSNPHVQFRSDGGNTGNISTNGSAVSYNASSDYRLKENVIPLKDGLDRLNKLNPVQFDWKKSQETDEGFIAHEVQEIVPYVVKGEKDGEEIQTMDYGKLTPLLVKAIQEQQAQIEALQSEINNLKGE
jgi:hypothetical protein